MRNKVRSLTAICITICTMMVLMSITAYTQEVAPPSLTCEIADNGDNTVTVSVFSDSNGDTIDAIRMEMIVDSTLSNPVVTRGSDFDTETPGVFIPVGENSYLVRTYGRSELTGAFVTQGTTFATIVFDWTGDPTTISFDQLGLLTGEGTYQSLQGTKDSLNVGTCSIGDGDGGTTVVDIVVDSPDHTILEDAVVAADLAGVLGDPDGAFTVFAPSDAIITAAGLTAADLTADILTTHVISGAVVMSGDITDGMTATAVSGNELTFMLDGGMVKIDGLLPGFIGVVEVADLTADNGVVHSITFEAEPTPTPTATPEPTTTVVDIVVNSPDHTILEDAVVAADLAGVLGDSDGAFTVFAPSDAILTAAGLTAADLTADILTTHVISGAVVMSGDITDGMTATAVSGNELTFMLDGGMVKIDGLLPGFIGVVEVADLTADNGVVHSITFEAAPAEESVTLTLLHNNDGESQLFPNSNTVLSSTTGLAENVDLLVGGISAFSTMMDNTIADAEAAGNSVLSVYAGDSFLASSIVNCSLPPSNLPIYDALAQNLLPYNAHVLGNHEFDFGPGFLFDYINGFTDHPFLSANLDFSNQAGLTDLEVMGIINSPVTGTPIADALIYTDPTTGEMFGVVGATTPLLANISNPGDVIVETADITETAAAVQTEVDELMAAGIDKIILVSHLQNINNDVMLISMVTGVDVAVGGGGDELLGMEANLLPGEAESVVDEYPRQISDADGNTVYLVTSKGGYAYLGELEITFDAAGMVTDISGAPIRVIPEAGNTDAIAALGITDAVANAADIDAILADVQACIDGFATTQLACTEPTLELARSQVRGMETNIGNLVSDSFIYVYDELGAQSGISSTNPVIAVQNGGGIRQNAGDTLDGFITRQNTLDILPFGNDVTVALDVPAETVKAALENAVGEIEQGVQGEFLQVGGFIFTYNSEAPAGSRVQSVIVADEGVMVGENGTVTLPAGVVLVANGEVVDDAPLVNVVMNSFMAGGGDGYEMFADLDQVNLSENGANITYERALTKYLIEDDARFPETTKEGVTLPTIMADDVAYQAGGEGRIIEVIPTAVSFSSVSSVSTNSVGTMLAVLSLAVLAIATMLIARRS